MDIQKENNLIKEAFNDEAHSRGFCLDQEWSDCENPYLDGDTNLAFDFFKSGWQAAIARMEVRINTLDEMLLNQGEALAQAKAQAVPEGFVLVKMDDLELLRDSALEIKYASLNNDSDRIFSDIEDIQLSIERLIEAQEPAND